MSRSAFDTTANVYTGPNATPANTFRFTTSCRLVANNHYGSQDSILSNFTHYVNWIGPSTSAGISIAIKLTVTHNRGTAERWEIPAGSGNWYLVVWSCEVGPTRDEDPPYRRANLRKL